MFGYSSTLDKSMNGIKTLTDGISIISDGIATHENIIYNDYIKSQDGLTEITNDTVTTINVDAQNITATNITGDDLNTNILNCNYLYVNDISNPLQDVMEVDGNLKKLKMKGISEFSNTVNVINTNVTQNQGGTIQQSGTNFNTFKDTKINGFLEVGSNITQTGGNTTLKDVTCDNITQNSGKGITQSGSVSNTLGGTTTVKNLTILDSVSFPSNVTIPGTTTNDDIVMQDDSVITQDITATTTKFNLLRDTKTLNLDVDGNITQTKAGATATLKNTTIQGSSTLQGDIEQTAGFTKLNTIECNNITLRENNDINFSGTGKITQTGNGSNTMNAITLNNNKNITFNGSGIISQPLNGTNILSHFRTAGFGIIGGRNNITFGHYQNIQNNNGLQMQYNRDNGSFYSYLLNNKVGTGGGFRFQRYNGGVYVDEPLIIDDNITFNKDVSIVGKSISASSATLGIITQNELDCLDNCNINILTKFNNLDSQIASLQTTTSGVSTATTGISYNLGSDTTTIDNNLIVSSGKNFTLGLTNVNSFITDTNTFISAATNTLQGIVYTSIDDTTTINNNVSVTGNFLVQGMNIKAEIIALETSFTTGTLTTTTLTAGTLNITNQINMTNPTRPYRSINNIGYANFCDMDASSDINSFSIGNAGSYTYFNSMKNNGIFQFTSLNTDNKIFLLPNVPGNGSYNPTTKADDILLLGLGGSVGTQSLNLSVWGNTGTGVRIEPTKTIMTGGNNKITVDNTDGVIIDGIQKINDSMRFYSGSNYTELKQTGNDFSINNKSPIPKILMGVNDMNLIDLNNTQIKINGTLLIENTAEFIPNILDESTFPKTLGTTNIYAGLMSVSAFKRQINVSLPISMYRQYKNVVQSAGLANLIEDTLLSVGYTIFKNGSYWGSGTCPTTDTLPKSVRITSSSSTSSRNYEIYMTNISFSFIPPFENSINVFTFYITPNYNTSVLIQSENLIVENFGYFTNTNVSTSTYPLTEGTPGTNYTSSSFTFSDYGLKYSTGSGVVKLNKLLTNTIDNQNDISTNTLTSTTINSNNLYCSGNIRINNGLAGYHIDGTSNYLPTPIFCSMKSFLRSNTDNCWFLNAGFKVELFNSPNYVSFITTLDNTNSLVGNVFDLTDSERDRTDSFKVYFLGVEVTYPLLS